MNAKQRRKVQREIERMVAEIAPDEFNLTMIKELNFLERQNQILMDENERLKEQLNAYTNSTSEKQY